MNALRHVSSLMLFAALTGSVWADIYRWDTGEVIPGTEGIEPGPGVQLDHLSLTFANLSYSELYEAAFNFSDLRYSSFVYSNLHSADMKGANLENANLVAAELSHADLTDASIRGAALDDTTVRGFVSEQLYSTASYREQVLQGIQLQHNDLTGWDFSNQDMAQSDLANSTLNNANFEGANLSHVNFVRTRLVSARFGESIVDSADFTGATQLGFAPPQLYSTSSYKSFKLKGLVLSKNDLSGWDFHRQDLTDAHLDEGMLVNANLRGAILKNANLYRTSLKNADLTDANITSIVLGDVTSLGFTKNQLYSTANYRAKDLRGVWFASNDFSGWSFRGQDLTEANLAASTLIGVDFRDANLSRLSLHDANLTRANLHRATLSNAGLGNALLMECDLRSADLTGAYLAGATMLNADLSGAHVTGAYFSDTTSHGFTSVQLYSTASYEAANLGGMDLSYNDLSGWDFHEQRMEGAYFVEADLSSADFKGTHLVGASFSDAVLAGTDFTDADITGATFLRTVATGFTHDQLSSTASFQSKNLEGIDLESNDLLGWNFQGQYLANASLFQSVLFEANFSLADLRGARVSELTGAVTRNTILSDGSILAPTLSSGDTLVIRNYREVAYGPRPVAVRNSMTMMPDGALEIRFDDERWRSLVQFEPNIPVQLNGTLELTFTDDADVATQVGRTFRIFDWTGVEPTGAFTMASRYPWDLDELYTTGEVTLLLPGDTNGDGTVDIVDLNNVRNNFGVAGPDIDGDTNANGLVDLMDLNNVRDYFGVTAPRAVPEPAAFVIAGVAMGLVGLAAGSRKRRGRCL